MKWGINMSKSLIIAEKPSVGREIARVLGCKSNNNGYIEGDKNIVTWALGHLVTLADPDIYNKKYATWKLEDLPITPNELKLVVIKQTSKQFATVKSLINRADVNEIIIATDAGREGELVARWILEKVGTKKPCKRLWTSSVTDKAIKEGFRNLKPGKNYENLYQAAVARAEADWIVGINATRALTTKYNAQLSCGRVQTPTLAIISNREDEIRKFVPQEYYGISCETDGMKLSWHDKKSNSTNSFEKNKIEAIFKTLDKQTCIIKNVDKKLKKTYSPALYDLTELQRDAYGRFNYSAKQTLSIMQKLYEQHKVLTYPRTDSRYLTNDIVETIPERLKTISIPTYQKVAFQLQKEKIRASKNFVDDAKVSDHHAIIPTEQIILMHKLSSEERNIYELVVKRFLQVLMPAFEYEETTVVAEIGGENFQSVGKRVIQLGWKELDNDLSKENLMPQIKVGDKLDIKKLKISTGETTPPANFNEATLLTAMENPGKYLDESDKNLKQILGDTGGLGTVATRADIIEKLYNTNLIEPVGKSLKITTKGKQLLDLAPTELKSPKLTAGWEQQLKLIEQGKLQRAKFITEMKKYTDEIVQGIRASEQKFRHDNVTTTKCPNCSKPMLEVKTKRGINLVCQDRDCGYKKSVSTITNARCPECHKKLELVGNDDKKLFVCKCGYKEKLESFEKRKKEQSKNGGKKDYIEYKKIQNKQNNIDVDESAFSALKGLFDKK